MADIDIGAAAIGREATASLTSFTVVGAENPADGDGWITSCEIWLESKISTVDVWVGTFSASGNDLTCRDSESIGDIAVGSKQTVSGLDITVMTGDYLGTHDKSGLYPAIEKDNSGDGYWSYTGECIDPSDSQTFTLIANRTISLYGEGSTEPPVTEKTSSDAGSGVDAYVSLETPQAKASSDIGSGVEGTPVQSAILAGSEAGSGIEALIARLLVAVDTGTGVEVGGLLKDLFASELGQGSDSLAVKIEMPTKGGGMKLWT